MFFWNFQIHRRDPNLQSKAYQKDIKLFFQVLVIEQRIIGRNKPSLALPYRRLVCYCRMYQVSGPEVDRKCAPK